MQVIGTPERPGPGQSRAGRPGPDRPSAGGLAVTDLHKSFGSLAVLRGLSLVAPEGSLTAILGPSGSGKTTLLRVLAGFERADGGTVTLDGIVVDDGRQLVPSDRRRIGYVPQEGALFPHLTVARNVTFGMDRGARRSGAADELLAMVGMSGLGRRYPHQLSGGQQQRVALARALAVRPRLVLLDEPFSSLDAGLRASVRADVRDVLRQAGTTAVLVTHDQDEALSWADHVAIIRDGRIGQFDTPNDVYRRPVDADLARFLGDANLLAGVADGRSVRTVMGVLPIPDSAPAPVPGEPMVVLVRPEQVELIAEPRGAYLTGEVVDYQYFGHDAVVRVRPDRNDDPPGADGSAGPETAVVVRVTGGAAWAPGTRVGLTTRGPVQAWSAPENTSA
ncbi:MAG TPA: ABC transporter ATP-binding protein [Acidimicrobiales bacterium]|nr:ABC transporter ATP-binding protein [Acidimicrobiales bacterium]